MPLIAVVLLVTAGVVLAETGTPIPAGTGSASPSMTSSGMAAEGASAPAESPGIFGMLFPFLLMFGILYFLIIRPQQKRMKNHQALISSLKQGDEVVTSSGILGTIRGLTEKVITLEVADNVKIKVLKSQIAQVVKGQIKDLEPNQN